MPTNGGTVITTHRTILLTPIPRHIHDDIPTGISRRLSGRATTQSLHATRRQMQRRSHTEDGPQNMSQTLILVTVVQMPPLVIMFRESRIRRRGRHVGIEQSRSSLVIWRVNNSQPVIDHATNLSVVVRRHGKFHGHAKITRAREDALPVRRKVIGERLS